MTGDRSADTAAASPRRLDRTTAHAPPPRPVRLVHLGLGNFFRAHQVAFTQHAPDAADWGYAAFTGRSRELVDAMAAQDGLYTLVSRGPDGDDFEIMHQVAAVHVGTDTAAWHERLASPDLAVVTLTVTEAGYLRGADGGIDVDDPATASDLAALRTDPTTRSTSTAVGRLVAGLATRRAHDAGPVTILPCDNLPDNGAVVRRLLVELATAVDDDLAAWIDANVDVATSMVDRITPATTDELRRIVAAGTGFDDRAPVMTEPFSEWVLAGRFRSGRPDWAGAGVRIVDDVEPYEQRKLWLLNGAHSLLAWAGPTRGHATVAEAIGDDVVRGWVEQLWDEAARHLPLPDEQVVDYRAALLERFANPGVRHLLAQIAADGSQKVAVRILPTLQRERAAGRVPEGAIRAVAAWVVHLRGDPADVADARADEVIGLAAGPLDDAVPRILDFLAPALADDHVVVDATVAAARALGAS